MVTAAVTLHSGTLGRQTTPWGLRRQPRELNAPRSLALSTDIRPRASCEKSAAPCPEKDEKDKVSRGCGVQGKRRAEAREVRGAGIFFLR